MNDTNDEWRHLLDEATRRADAEGRGDVSDYLRLRRSNDEARLAGIRELLRMFVAELERETNGGASLKVERDRAHRFPLRAATIVGERVTFRRGVRALTIEAGFPRTPEDGFIPGGGLARARVSHFGDERAGVALALARDAGTIGWFRLDEDGFNRAGAFAEAEARAHVLRFLGGA